MIALALTTASARAELPKKAVLLPQGTKIHVPNTLSAVLREDRFLIMRKQLDFANFAVEDNKQLRSRLDECLDFNKRPPAPAPSAGSWMWYGFVGAAAFSVGYLLAG